MITMIALLNNTARQKGISIPCLSVFLNAYAVLHFSAELEKIVYNYEKVSHCLTRAFIVSDCATGDNCGKYIRCTRSQFDKN